MDLCSQSSQPFHPLAMLAKAWQAIPGVSVWEMTMVRRGYTLQFAWRPPRFCGVLATTVCSEDAQVLRAEVMNLLEKGAIEIVHPAQTESGFYSRYFLVPKKRRRPATYSRSQTPELCPDEKVIQDDHFETDPAGSPWLLPGRCTVGCPLLQVCTLGWVKCREHISLLIILCIIVYVTNKAHPSLICICCVLYCRTAFCWLR